MHTDHTHHTELPPIQSLSNHPTSCPSSRILAFVADWHAVDTLRARVDAAGLTDQIHIHHISALPSRTSLAPPASSPTTQAACTPHP